MRPAKNSTFSTGAGVRNCSCDSKRYVFVLVRKGLNERYAQHGKT
jgi:hypothetical protein